MKLKELSSLLLIFTIWLNLFSPFISAQTVETSTPENAEQEEEKGLEFRIREGVKQSEKREVSKVAETVKLSDAETNAILRRLPPLEPAPTDKNDFALREGSLLPPKTGNIITAKFPAEENQNAPNIKPDKAAALEVARFSPEGNVPVVADLSVTFSQPMIVVSSQTQASEDVPVKLSLQPKGKWRWVGTETLVFDTEGRFPMATKYVATIPAGTKSANGGRLEKEVSWSFSTPPPSLISFNPSGETVTRDALLLAYFDLRFIEDFFV